MDELAIVTFLLQLYNMATNKPTEDDEFGAERDLDHSTEAEEFGGMLSTEQVPIRAHTDTHRHPRTLTFTQTPIASTLISLLKFTRDKAFRLLTGICV